MFEVLWILILLTMKENFGVESDIIQYDMITITVKKLFQSFSFLKNNLSFEWLIIILSSIPINKNTNIQLIFEKLTFVISYLLNVFSIALRTKCVIATPFRGPLVPVE